ncbi:hypothetical protein P7M77_03075 [Vibrio parahaemolyticus]|nr:hypothetical protein [Vibrio parahaemolyticus]MDG2729015.1 hypothetical protein [Vibrio parahaemolyticus]HBC3391088.1 hypothetical protein [Vibrio parahaemolyticus]HBC3577907.1 hypothetical protein [Vibrio parahaemolyticus]HBC3947641.1 hypothetical protein [Vibrio parahaemolyticus]
MSKHLYIMFICVIYLGISNVSAEEPSYTCVNVSGNKQQIFNANINLQQKDNYTNSVIFDEIFDISPISVECECGSESETLYTTDFDGFSAGGDFEYWNGELWYKLIGSEHLMYNFSTNIVLDNSNSMVWKSFNFNRIADSIPERCSGPSQLSSFTKARIRLRLIKPLVGNEIINNRIGNLYARRWAAGSRGTSIMNAYLHGTVNSNHSCSAAVSSTNVKFNTDFLSGFEDSQFPKTNPRISSQKVSTSLQCTYSDVPVEVELLGDFSDYGLKTNIPGVEIQITTGLGFDRSDLVTNNHRNFDTMLDEKGRKTFEFNSLPILTKDKSLINPGQYGASLIIRTNFK